MAPPKGKQKATQMTTETETETFKIQWSDFRTDRLIDWLEQHPTERHMLFSDSTQDARAEGRRTDVGKTAKTMYYALIADQIFANDQNADYVKHYFLNKSKFAESVGDRLATLVLLTVPTFCLLMFPLQSQDKVSRESLDPVYDWFWPDMESVNSKS